MFSRPPDLADPFRRLLEAVTGALRAEGRQGWLGGAIGLLLWMRTRRMRREREAALEQFKALLEQFLALLEDFRAGKLSAPTAQQVGEVASLPRRAEKEEEPPSQPSPARAEEGVKGADDADIVPLWFSEPSAVNSLDYGEHRGAQRRRSGRIFTVEGGRFTSGKHWIPAPVRTGSRVVARMPRLEQRTARARPRSAACHSGVRPRPPEPRARPPPGEVVLAGNLLKRA